MTEDNQVERVSTNYCCFLVLYPAGRDEDEREEMLERKRKAKKEAKKKGRSKSGSAAFIDH